MNKNLPKLVKYIFPSNKQRTRVWFAGYRGLHLHLPFTSINVVSIADLAKTTSVSTPISCSIREMNHKSAAMDEYILGVRKET